jgi:multiple sugar transport system substrate-binding protein
MLARLASKSPSGQRPCAKCLFTALAQRTYDFVIRRLFPLCTFLLVVGGCTRSHRGADENTIVFKYQPLWGDPEPFRAVLRAFEQAHLGVRVVTEALPNASDVAHQYFLTALEGRATEFDLLIVDVVWVQEFARAGWIADLSEAIPPQEIRNIFLKGPAEAVLVQNRTYAVPWYVDVGLLYYRTDLVPEAPRTYASLQSLAQAAMKRDPRLQGFVWQGRQYEGLLCNTYEAIWGHGGTSLSEGRVTVDTPQARAALSYLRGLITSGVTPPSVLSAAEEESRHVFHAGHAVFMRNWPYAWVEAQREDSPVRGKVGVTSLPTLDGGPGVGTLGGWQLAVNAHISERKKQLAVELIRFLTSRQTSVEFAITYGRNPARRDAYTDPRLGREAPFIASLLPMVEHAEPRPVTPYYTLFSDDLQGEFSAAISGIRTPEVALERAQRRIDRLTGIYP